MGRPTTQTYPRQLAGEDTLGVVGRPKTQSWGALLAASWPWNARREALSGLRDSPQERMP